MTTLNIDNKEYELESLSDYAREQLAGVQLCDQKMQQLRQEMALLQTARNAYSIALQAALQDAETA